MIGRGPLATAERTPPARAQGVMASDENAFFGLKVPEGNDRRELYKSQYRAIYTCTRRPRRPRRRAARRAARRAVGTVALMLSLPPPRAQTR
jgi:hypothetical protein